MGFFSGGKSTSTSTSFTPAQSAGLTTTLQQYLPTLGQGQNSYEGTRVAPMTGTQQEALDLGGWSQYLQPNNMPMYGETGNALSGILGGQTGAEPYTKESIDTLFKAAYEQPTMQRWNDYLQPEIRESYSGPGFWGTSRMGAEAKGAQGVNDFLNQQYGQLLYSADQSNKAIEEAKAGRALSAIPAGMSYGQQPLQNALAALQGRAEMYGLGTAEQQQQQAEIEANIQKFAEENRITNPEDLQVILELLGMGYQTSESKQTKDSMGMRWAAPLT
jgi:hypothetical protein